VKHLADALRYEALAGRACHVRRGRYGPSPSYAPRSGSIRYTPPSSDAA
jgi:hypothetical protein